MPSHIYTLANEMKPFQVAAKNYHLHMIRKDTRSRYYRSISPLSRVYKLSIESQMWNASRTDLQIILVYK